MNNKFDILKHELDKAERKYRSASTQLTLAILWLLIGVIVCLVDITCGGLIAVTGILAVALTAGNKSVANDRVKRIEAEWRKSVED